MKAICIRSLEPLFKKHKLYEYNTANNNNIFIKNQVIYEISTSEKATLPVQKVIRFVEFNRNTGMTTVTLSAKGFAHHFRKFL